MFSILFHKSEASVHLSGSFTPVTPIKSDIRGGNGHLPLVEDCCPLFFLAATNARVPQQGAPEGRPIYVQTGCWHLTTWHYWGHSDWIQERTKW